MHPVMINAIAAEHVREDQARAAAASRARQVRGARRRVARPRVPAQRRLQAWFSVSASLRAR
jgi:hypothetical protein